MPNKPNGLGFKTVRVFLPSETFKTRLWSTLLHFSQHFLHALVKEKRKARKPCVGWTDAGTSSPRLLCFLATENICLRQDQWGQALSGVCCLQLLWTGYFRSLESSERLTPTGARALRTSARLCFCLNPHRLRLQASWRSARSLWVRWMRHPGKDITVGRGKEALKTAARQKFLKGKNPWLNYNWCIGGKQLFLP